MVTVVPLTLGRARSGDGVGIVVLNGLTSAGGRRYHSRRSVAVDQQRQGQQSQLHGAQCRGSGGSDHRSFGDGRSVCDGLYVETHGAGTPLGDPGEIAALTEVFRPMPGQTIL